MRRKWSREVLLDEACAWGDLLCRDAYWYEDRCSWIGHSPKEAPNEGPLRYGVSTLGPDVYAGTAGVALFLAQLYTIRPRDAYRKTALGAARHALNHADKVEVPGRIGFYSGYTGIAFASGVVGRLLGIDDFEARAVALARRAADVTTGARIFDFIAGSSSAICALLAMRTWHCLLYTSPSPRDS